MERAAGAFYDKFPDYGGPEPALRGFVVAAVVIVTLAALIALFAGWI